ncbi:hypothetical protein [Streptomyces sp. SPB162]|uniref:hypothetical protein n=1 Tax=Streptomyces sp. SPB162 TaxID=2940560 RepID=UPI002406ABC6|nr:hypothetical protein [Streptomyces sp. SPB162]MDF9814779.1 hypothetical protein [Streptomyces sp. SPB162]
MSDDLINPAGIPQFTGNLENLETDAAALVTQAGHFRSSGASVNSEFQGLSAFYKAPEAEQLFATTIPVATKADAFARDLEKVASALRDYGGEVRPIVARLESLTHSAWSFVQSIEDDGDWREDKKKVQHNNDLWHDVNATLDAFWAAERSCYGKITGLVGGAPLIPDDGTHKQNMYGYKADDLDHAEETAWGSTTDREYSGLAWLGHQVKSYVWDGFVVDGVWGTVMGLGTLFGKDGWDAAGKAWTGLAKLATGLSIMITPVVGTIYMALPDDKLPGILRDSRTAVKQTGKALIAYDEWGKNPARAAGAVTFNVITAIFTDGAGSAAKSGAVAKTISVLGKTGRALDPVTYVIKGGKFAVVKVGDMLSGLKNLRTGVLLDTAAGGYRLPDLDDALAPPPVGLPESTVRLIDREGRTVYLDPAEGTLFNESGKVIQHADDIRREPSAAELAEVERNEAEPNPLPRREPVLVGAHAGDGPGGGGGGGHGTDSGAPRSEQQGGNGSDGTGNNGRRSETPEEFQERVRQQVYRANNEPGYYDRYYRSGTDGTRVSTTLKDESGYPPPQLVKKPGTDELIAKSDEPDPLPEKYLGGSKNEILPPAKKDLRELRAKALERHNAIQADTLAKERLKAAKAIPDNAPGIKAAEAAQSVTARNMTNAAREYGEMVAERHVIPDRYSNATREPLEGPRNGNDQFDQVWRREDGGYVVIEAKSSVDTPLGSRKLPDGTRVSQGTREYFDDIIRKMHARGRADPGGPEATLAKALEDALEDGKLEYILVKGNPNTGTYTGYSAQEFDIG